MTTHEERLAQIRDQIAAARALERERDKLLRELASRYTLERLAEMAGVTRGRVHQIVGKRDAKIAK